MNHSFSKYLFNAYIVPDAVLIPSERVGNQTDPLTHTSSSDSDLPQTSGFWVCFDEFESVTHFLNMKKRRTQIG